MAGPDRPRWVNSMASGKRGPSAARASTGSATPASGRIISSASASKVSGTRPGRVSTTRSPKRRARSSEKPVAPIFGMDSPPVASTRDSEATVPRPVTVWKGPGFVTSVTRAPVSITTPTAAHSASSMARMSLAERSQNSWPRVFSCQGMRCFSTISRKSRGRKRDSAERAKRGLAEMKRSGAVPVLVKLHRPPPEIRILDPACGAWSSTSTRRPRRPALMAHISPAAPAPRMTAS